MIWGFFKLNGSGVSVTDFNFASSYYCQQKYIWILLIIIVKIIYLNSVLVQFWSEKILLWLKLWLNLLVDKINTAQNFLTVLSCMKLLTTFNSLWTPKYFLKTKQMNYDWIQNKDTYCAIFGCPKPRTDSCHHRIALTQDVLGKWQNQIRRLLKQKQNFFI